MSEELSYKLEKFEGPLDLLLHLIEKNKINIYDIPISIITKQYLEYVESMEEDDLDIMSDFLVMAATLLDIKAKLLLPAEVDDDSGEEIDPRAELVERLLEHKRYKHMALELADMEYGTDKVLYKTADLPKEVAMYEYPVDLDALLADIKLHRLKCIYEEVLKRQEYRVDKQRSNFGSIKREPIRLADKVGNLLSYARMHRFFSFRSILHKSESRVELVVSFLAILELMKLGKISLTQKELFDDILIECIEPEGEDEILDLSELGDM